MNNLITLDLESPTFPSPDDDSTDAMIERAERKARRLQKVIAHRGEVRLAEAAIFYDDMDLDEQILYGRLSKYFFRKKCLERSQMVMLRKLIEKYEEER